MASTNLDKYAHEVCAKLSSTTLTVEHMQKFCKVITDFCLSCCTTDEDVPYSVSTPPTTKGNPVAQQTYKNFVSHRLRKHISDAELARVFWQTDARKAFNTIINGCRGYKTIEKVQDIITDPEMAPALQMRKLYDLINERVLGGTLDTYDEVVNFAPDEKRFWGKKKVVLYGMTSQRGNLIDIFFHPPGCGVNWYMTLAHEMAHAMSMKLAVSQADDHGEVFQYILRKISERTGIVSHENRDPCCQRYVYICSRCEMDADETNVPPNWPDLVYNGQCDYCYRKGVMTVFKKDLKYEGAVYSAMMPPVAMSRFYTDRLTHHLLEKEKKTHRINFLSFCDVTVKNNRKRKAPAKKTVDEKISFEELNRLFDSVVDVVVKKQRVDDDDDVIVIE